MPEVLYVIYDVTNRVMREYYDLMYDANNQLKLLSLICPDNTYKLVVYKRYMICDTHLENNVESSSWLMGRFEEVV